MSTSSVISSGLTYPLRENIIQAWQSLLHTCLLLSGIGPKEEDARRSMPQQVDASWVDKLRAEFDC